MSSPLFAHLLFSLRSDSVVSIAVMGNKVPVGPEAAADMSFFAVQCHVAV